MGNDPHRFERAVSCLDCGRGYLVSGVSLSPGVETEAPVSLPCACGGWVFTFVPGSVNTERLVLTPLVAGSG